MALRYNNFHRFFLNHVFTRPTYSLCKHHVKPLHKKTTPLSHIPQVRRIHMSMQLAKTVPYVLSDIGEGIVEVVVKEWFVKPGDKVSQFDPVCEVQSDKASVTITSRYDGIVEKLHYDVETVAKVGKPLLDIGIAEDAEDAEEATPEEISVGTPLVEQTEDRFFTNKALATPAVRRIAKENKVDLSQVPATGKAGRVLKEDILSFLEKKSESVQQDPIESVGGDRMEYLTGVKKAMFKSMSDAWRIPHFGYADELDLTELLTFRSEARLEKKAGVKVTNLPFIIKAVSLALLRYPSLNAHMDESGPRLTIRAQHNIGIAMDTPQGLVVPVVKNIQNRSVIQIAQELSRLQLLGGQNKLGMEDLSGGTITLSNIGAIGGTQASPILLPPQIVIGAITKVLRVPRYNLEGSVVPRDIATISWSADHRATDGATVARFSNLFKLYLTAPQLLLEL